MPPLILGVTGSIATGKGLVCQTLVELGCMHCDADKLVHRMYDPGKPAFDRIVTIFGRDIIGPDGFIDRKVLGSRVFGNSEAMTKLTAAIGDIAGEVKGVIDGWRASLPEDGCGVMEAVNWIDAGYGIWADQTWLLACSFELARQRLMARNGFSPEEANQRLASQRPWQERAPASDFILFNDGTPQEAEAKVRAEFQHIRELWRQGGLPRSRYEVWHREHWLPTRGRR